MFAIYNDGSLKTRGSVEQLYNLKKIHKIHETINHNNNPSQEFPFSKSQDDNNNLTKDAINTYKKNSNIDTRELVYHVSQIMNREIIWIHESSTVQETYSILKEKHIRQLPIIDKIGKIKSMISQKDILELIFNDLENVNRNLKKSINEIRLPEIITTDPISDVRRIAKVMVDYHLNAMPIVNEDDILVGIVSRNDILKTIASVPPLQLWA